MNFQFCINIFLRSRTDGWYVVTKGKICLRVFFFCCRADCLPAKLTSDNVVCIILWGYPRVMRRDLNLEIIIIKVFISSQDKKYISYVTFEYLSKKVPT